MAILVAVATTGADLYQICIPSGGLGGHYYLLHTCAIRGAGPDDARTPRPRTRSELGPGLDGHGKYADVMQPSSRSNKSTPALRQYGHFPLLLQLRCIAPRDVQVVPRLQRLSSHSLLRIYDAMLSDRLRNS